MQQRMMRGAKRALAMAAVCLLAVASACTGPKLAADSFDDFCTRVIREMVGEDYVTIHFFFDDPDALGLGDVAPTFGRYTAEADEEEAERSAAMIRDLMRYDRDTLSQSQQKTYDLLLWTLQSAVPAAPMYYENPNAPNFGWQAQIQISLAELALDTEEDVENYLALLSDMPRYAEELMQYQQEKKEAGLGISAEQAELAIEECETFLQAGEENILLRSFDERIDGMEGLAQAQKESYKQRNREAVQTYCLPAYQTMAEGLENAKDESSDGSLASLPQGRMVYKTLVRQYTLSQASPEEIQDDGDAQPYLAGPGRLPGVGADGPGHGGAGTERNMVSGEDAGGFPGAFGRGAVYGEPGIPGAGGYHPKPSVLHDPVCGQRGGGKPHLYQPKAYGGQRAANLGA